MNFLKSVFIVVLIFGSKVVAQDGGYFGKKNALNIDGTWFLRSIPQIFYTEDIYFYNPRKDIFQSGYFRNHIWNVGLSYKRLIRKNSALGLRFDLGTRNLGSPNLRADEKSTFSSPWENILENAVVWSNDHQKYVDLNNLVLSRTNVVNRQVFVSWSRSKTASVFPIGLTSTFGLGAQWTTMNTTKGVFSKANTKDLLSDPWSVDQEILRTSFTQTSKDPYLGLAWLWQLDLNYALTRNFLFTIGTDFRGIVHVFRLSKDDEIINRFPLSLNGTPTLESLIYGRNLSNEIRREMIFQNTFKIGLTLVF